jgi:ATP-binding cassette subfamily B protein
MPTELAHRQRQAVLTDYFEHIMQLPLTFHTGTHSGRLMKVMLNGTDSLWRLWLGFFREHFAAILSLVVLLPLAFYINWRLAILLFVLCVVFTVLTTLVVRKTYGMQSEVEAHYSDLSGARLRRARQRRAGAEFRADRRRGAGPALRRRQAARRADAGTGLVGAGHRHHPRLHHHHRARDLHRRHLPARPGETTVGEIVMFVSFATMLIQKLEQVVSFINNVFMEAPRLQEFFDVLDAVPAVRDRPTATDTGRLSASSNSTTSRFPMTASGPRSRTFRLPPCPARPSRWSARPAPASRPRSRCCTAPSIRNPASSRSTAWISAA